MDASISSSQKVGEMLGPSGQLVLRAQLCPRPADINTHFASRREVGYVGIKNQGATCYLNSLVQALFHIGAFRESVFKLTMEKDQQFLEVFSFRFSFSYLSQSQGLQTETTTGTTGSMS